METDASTAKPGVLLLVAGAKGAVGSTVAAMVAGLRRDPETVLPWLTTSSAFPGLMADSEVVFSGWDTHEGSLVEALDQHGVLPASVWGVYEKFLSDVRILRPPCGSLESQTAQLMSQLKELSAAHPSCKPVVANLLPAAPRPNWPKAGSLEELLRVSHGEAPPDLAYACAAVRCGVPFVNFTSNEVEHPLLVEEARAGGVPLAGRDGKTGQTYLKVVLASALKARRLKVEGWYSLNILGNRDGRNLADPSRAEGKLVNKTQVLEEVLGYPVGDSPPGCAHTVHIAYYPPRGDAKEAWDVVDFKGLFGLPMSLRLNLLARDSVLAAPLVLDLARWMVGLQAIGRSGLVPELGFYFKKPLGDAPPRTFEEQLAALELLRGQCANFGGCP
ncbi:MAG: inositol-3-phosphate synthase [Thermodesulfobacteriota bacterium]